MSVHYILYMHVSSVWSAEASSLSAGGHFSDVVF